MVNLKYVTEPDFPTMDPTISAIAILIRHISSRFKDRKRQSVEPFQLDKYELFDGKMKKFHRML